MIDCRHEWRPGEQPTSFSALVGARVLGPAHQTGTTTDLSFIRRQEI